MEKFLLCVLTLVGIVGFSTSAFAADDLQNVEITTPASVEEAEKIYEEVYAETPFIKNTALNGDITGSGAVLNP